jgi:DnaJ-domain-containing protein 1
MDQRGDLNDLHEAVSRLVVAMMIADGRVSAEELDVVARLDHAGLGPLSSRVHRELDRASRQPIDVDGACATVRSAGVALVGAVLSMLARVAAAGQRLTASEQEFFAAIAHRLGVDGDQTRSHLQPLRHDPQPVAPPRRPSSDAADAALRQLGLNRDATSADVDAAYLRLVDRYHPGKVAPLGADFVTLAVRELVALTEAYERARGAVRA